MLFSCGHYLPDHNDVKLNTDLAKIAICPFLGNVYKCLCMCEKEKEKIRVRGVSLSMKENYTFTLNGEKSVNAPN
jgi:hypothetical protein